MAISDSSESTPKSASNDASPELASESRAKVVEPLTEQSALEWNRYYDRYVAGGVLLLVFLVSAHRITGGASRIWPMIKAGEIMASTGIPMTFDRFSFSENGNRWVNIPWVFEVASHYLYNSGRSLISSDEAMSPQIGAAFLVVFAALARFLTAWILLRLRRPGPGLWWQAIVVAVALGVVFSPRSDSFEVGVGGIARQANVGPEVWGTCFLALLVLLVDRGLELNKKRFLYAIPALFLVWANVDESFAIGLVFLAASMVGSLLDRRKAESRERPKLALLAAVFLGSVAICLVNPSTYHVFPHAMEPILTIPRLWFGYDPLIPMPDHLSYFGKLSEDFLKGRANGSLAPVQTRQIYFAGVVITGLASFVLNREGLRFRRLVSFGIVTLLWAGLGRLSAEFAIVFAWVVGLNGQEWYQRTYGTHGRVSRGWTSWSIGGRSITIVVFFLVMWKTLTGYEYGIGRPTFGFGVEMSDFDFDSADSLKKLRLEGEVMNLTESTGDAIVWRGYPLRKTFIDRRRGLFGPEIREQISRFRQAFKPTADAKSIEEDVAIWSPVMDKYNASAVIYSIEEPENIPIYFGMIRSSNWIPIRDDGRTVVFGRADAKVAAADLEVFKSNRLDAAEIVYNRKEILPFPDRAPSAMTFFDKIVRNRSLQRTQPHVEAATRWLLSGAEKSTDGLPDAAHCLMAIREARIALAASPDDSAAYRTLDNAYKLLTTNESRLLAGKLSTPPNDYLNFRARQRITALNYAIQTTPPPLNADQKRNLATTHFDLAAVHRAVGDLDLERDNLEAAQALLGADEFPSGELQRLEGLDEGIERFRDDLQKFATEVGADGIQKATRAVQAGFPGIALRELEDAESQGVSTDRILMILVDLYNRTGQPEKANERIIGRTMNDQALNSGPGTPAYRIGTVNFLLGFYENTANLWRDYAIVQVRAAQTNIGLSVGRELLGGQALEATSNIMSLATVPGQLGLLATEANWIAELGFCLLESGDPKEAGKQFAEALRIYPQIPIRPILEDYLKKLGIPIPGSEPAATPVAPAEGVPAVETKPAEAPATTEEKPKSP